MKPKEFKVGDTATAKLRKSNGDYVEVRGKIKSIISAYGTNTYTITEGVVSDFVTRKIK